MKARMTILLLIALTAGCTTPGYRVALFPLDPAAGAWTLSEHRTYFFLGRTRTQFESLNEWCLLEGVNGRPDCIHEVMVDSAFTTCIDEFPNGVMTGISMRELNNRTWTQAAQSCRDMNLDGEPEGPTVEHDLFDYTVAGDEFSTSIPEGHLAIGAVNIHLVPGNNRIRSLRLAYATAEDILAMGENGVRPQDSGDVLITQGGAPEINSVWTAVDADFAWCPPGKVMTGAMIGHQMTNQNQTADVWYLIAECRTLLYVGGNPP